jgi:hypothetical protein
MRVRLESCGCSPTSYSGGSYATLVHGPGCDRAEKALTIAERAEWSAKVAHPAGKDLPDFPEIRTALRGVLPLETPEQRSALAAWLLHDPGHDCENCLYVEAHLDSARDAVTR